MNTVRPSASNLMEKMDMCEIEWQRKMIEVYNRHIIEPLLVRFYHIAFLQKTCLSCGAKTDIRGDLPCGH